MLEPKCDTHGPLNLGAFYVRRKSNGREYYTCIACDKGVKRANYLVNSGHIRKRVLSNQIDLKMEVLSRYSGGIPHCCNCNEDEIRFLGLDHVFNDGNIFRQSHSSGQAIYHWAKRSYFPPNLQVLCHNCNWRKRPLNKSVSYRYTFVRKARLEVLTHYANGILKCAECPESDLRVLTIDHINGGGAAYTRQLGTQTVYAYLKNQGFPPGYQVLCQNHNLGKHCLSFDDYRRAA
jgi:hypothetical protein